MLSAKKIVGICAAALVSGGVTAALVLVPGASASPGTRTATTTTVTAPASVAAGTPFTVSIAVNDGGGNPIGLVDLWQGTSPLCSGILAGGTVSCSISLPTAGSVTLTGQYLGSRVDAPSTGTATITVTGSGGGGGGAGPVFTAASPPLSALPGQPYGYTFAASGTPAPTFTLSNAPSWLSINPTSGQLAGFVPSGATGTFSYSVVATNSTGSSAVGPFTVSLSGGASEAVVGAGMSCPTTLHAGASVTCDVTVTNEGPGTATSTVLAVQLPSVVSESSCSGGCSATSTSAVWDFGSLATGAVESVSVTFTVGTPAKPISFWIISAKATTTAFDPLPFAGQTAVHVKVLA